MGDCGGRKMVEKLEKTRRRRRRAWRIVERRNCCMTHAIAQRAKTMLADIGGGHKDGSYDLEDDRDSGVCESLEVRVYVIIRWDGFFVKRVDRVPGNVDIDLWVICK